MSQRRRVVGVRESAVEVRFESGLPIFKPTTDTLCPPSVIIIGVRCSTASKFFANVQTAIQWAASRPETINSTPAPRPSTLVLFFMIWASVEVWEPRRAFTRPVVFYNQNLQNSSFNLSISEFQTVDVNGCLSTCLSSACAAVLLAMLDDGKALPLPLRRNEFNETR